MDLPQHPTTALRSTSEEYKLFAIAKVRYAVCSALLHDKKRIAGHELHLRIALSARQYHGTAFSKHTICSTSGARLANAYNALGR